MQLEQAALVGEATCLLRRYIRIDTTNPPGNEAAAAQFLQAFLKQEGIEATLYESAPGRANLYARLKGDGSKKALMLVHHLDVVPAQASEWSIPPFEGEIRDGYLWGRGSMDNKGPGIMEVLAFVMLKRLGVPLRRDVVLAAMADEEQGGAKGARFMVDQHFDVLQDVEYALNEGGGILQNADKQSFYSIEFAQKVPLWLRVTAKGPTGHTSMPKHEASTHRLIRALARLEQYEFPLVVVPAVQSVFIRRAEKMPPEKRDAYRNLERSLQDAAFRDEFMKDPQNAIMVRNTLAVTMLNGSTKENVYPGQASAVLDLRLLPGQDPSQVITTLEKVMNEPSTTVEPMLSSMAHASPVDTELFQMIETVVHRHDSGARLMPNFLSGFTDCNTLRSKGIICYGFMPMRIALSDIERIHGRDERIATEELGQGTLLLHELVRDFAKR